jgi:hypothetical protein
MHSWPFSLKENGAAITPPLHSNREIALVGIAALGMADHRYSGKTDARIGHRFFFHPDNAEIAETAPPAEAEP